MRRYLIGFSLVFLALLGIFIGYAESRYSFSTQGLSKKMFLVKPRLLLYEWLLSRETKFKFNFSEKIQINITDQKQDFYLIENPSGEVFESMSFENCFDLQGLSLRS